MCCISAHFCVFIPASYYTEFYFYIYCNKNVNFKPWYSLHLFFVLFFLNIYSAFVHLDMEQSCHWTEYLHHYCILIDVVVPVLGCVIISSFVFELRGEIIILLGRNRTVDGAKHIMKREVVCLLLFLIFECLVLKSAWKHFLMPSEGLWAARVQCPHVVRIPFLFV